MNCIDFQDRINTLNAMWDEEFAEWTKIIERHEPQRVIDRHQRLCRSIKRTLTSVVNRLYATKKERMIRDINAMKELVQDAAQLRATQGENAGGP